MRMREEGPNVEPSGRWRSRAGDGLRALLDEKHKLDLDDATRISNLSLLRGRDLGPEALRATARRVLGEALRPLETAARARSAA